MSSLQKKLVKLGVIVIVSILLLVLTTLGILWVLNNINLEPVAVIGLATLPCIISLVAWVWVVFRNKGENAERLSTAFMALSLGFFFVVMLAWEAQKLATGWPAYAVAAVAGMCTVAALYILTTPTSDKKTKA